MRVLAENADELASRAKEGVTQAEGMLRKFKLPRPPSATHTGTAPATKPQFSPARPDKPTDGDLATGVVLGSLAVVLGYRELRRRKKEGKTRND